MIDPAGGVPLLIGPWQRGNGRNGLGRENGLWSSRGCSEPCPCAGLSGSRRSPFAWSVSAGMSLLPCARACRSSRILRHERAAPFFFALIGLPHWRGLLAVSVMPRVRLRHLSANLWTRGRKLIPEDGSRASGREAARVCRSRCLDPSAARPPRPVSRVWRARGTSCFARRGFTVTGGTHTELASSPTSAPIGAAPTARPEARRGELERPKRYLTKRSRGSRHSGLCARANRDRHGASC